MDAAVPYLTEPLRDLLTGEAAATVRRGSAFGYASLPHGNISVVHRTCAPRCEPRAT